MKKAIYFITAGLLMLTGCSSTDEPLEQSSALDVNDVHFVSLKDAVEKAESLFSQFNGVTRAGSYSSISSVESLSASKTGETRSGSDTPLYYIVNFGEGEGFAILSADDRLMPVYAFSDEGSLALSDTVSNEGLKAYINTLPGMIGGPEPFDPDTPVIQFLSYNNVYTSPLLSNSVRHWHQRAPYNKFCFTKYGKQSVTGCTPLAVAMLMSHFEYPKSYNGYSLSWSSYKDGIENDNLYRFIADLGSPANLYSYYTEDSAGTDPYRIGDVFTNMGYEYSKAGMTESLMISEINKEKRPVLMDGVTGGAGHNWVVDGTWLVMSQHYGKVDGETGKAEIETETHWYYHNVWGWEGKGNGYYLYENKKMGGDADYREDDESYFRVPVFGGLVVYYNFKTK